MKQINILAVIALVSVLGLVACDSWGVTMSVMPTPVSIIPTTTFQPTPTQTPIAILLPTRTLTSPPTEVLTAIPTATPCPTPIPGGPVGQIIFSAVPCTEAGIDCEVHESSVADIYLINSDGTGLRQLIEGGGLISGLSLSPDGRKLAFIDSREDLQHSPFRSHVYVWDISMGAIQPLMADLPDEETEQVPQWFPDSNRLAYVSGLVDNRGTTLGDSPTNLYTVRVDGTGRTKVTERPPKSYIQSMVISPDGSQIAFVGREWNSGLLEKVAAYCVNADGSNLRKLMVFPPPAYFAELFWSPDGTKVFAFDPTEEYPAILYVLQPDRVPVGQSDFLQIPGRFTEWRWASDSEIEIAACERGVGTSVWTVNVNDLGLRKQMSIPREQCIGMRTGGWSPDGTYVAFSEHVGPPELFGLYVLDVNTGCIRQILGGYYVLDLLWLPADATIP